MSGAKNIGAAVQVVSALRGRTLLLMLPMVAGAALATSSGEVLVRAAWGVAMSTRSVPGAPDWPVRPRALRRKNRLPAPAT